jgi:hypothetical protein
MSPITYLHDLWKTEIKKPTTAQAESFQDAAVEALPFMYLQMTE